MANDEMRAAIAALEEIKNQLKRHWMIDKPGAKKSSEEDIEVKSGEGDTPVEEAIEETETADAPQDIEEVARNAMDEEDRPMSVIDYGTRRGLRGPALASAPAQDAPMPVKRPRGRPRKVL